jgi:hypothetical protein
MGPHNDASSLLQCTNVLGRYMVLLEVPNAPNLPNFCRISPFLFNNPQKTTNKRYKTMEKNTLRVYLVISIKTQNISK